MLSVAFAVVLGALDRPYHPVRVTNRPGNVQGSVLILEYHRIGKKNSTWTRSAKSFRKDLSRLYSMGYRPVTLTEYLENRMELPRGASPVIITFDDSHISQFSIDKQGRVDPNCAVGIWQRFAENRRAFPLKAVFFVLPPRPFGSGRTMRKKLAKLQEWGCEIGSHSLSHRPFGDLTDEQVKREIAGSKDWLKDLGVPAKYLALPYGSLPKNKALLERFQMNGRNYNFDAVLLAGSNPSWSPTSTRLRRLRLPRVQAVGGDYGIDYWLRRVKTGKSKPYVQP